MSLVSFRACLLLLTTSTILGYGKGNPLQVHRRQDDSTTSADLITVSSSQGQRTGTGGPCGAGNGQGGKGTHTSCSPSTTFAPPRPEAKYTVTFLVAAGLLAAVIIVVVLLYRRWKGPMRFNVLTENDEQLLGMDSYAGAGDDEDDVVFTQGEIHGGLVDEEGLLDA
eukprot:m.26929 g.26929  ORF g.26929 m.26929 type:complete len:167 (-) comp7846_c0_seq1:83-583(-)